MFRSLMSVVVALVLLVAGPALADFDDDGFFSAQLGLSGNVGHDPLKRTVVRWDGDHAPGTIIVDTTARRLFFVLEGGEAVRYAVGVGREGFAWSGTSHVSRKAEWPSWTPPAEMRKRQPELPAFMPGGPDNPMGARALYLGASLYRIHGTNNQRSVGRAMSSGCIRMMNEDVVDLYQRTRIGARVIVR